MSAASLLRLTILAAIWGASFLFMRILAPVLGPLWTAELRVAIAGMALLLFVMARGGWMQWRSNGKAYLILGFFSSALPFVLYAFAALTLPAGYLAIINATTPLWGSLLSAALLNERLTRRKIAGLCAGIAGVFFLVRLGPVPFTTELMLAALACTGATFCYGIASIYTKKQAASIAPSQMATGSQVAAALVLLPLLPFAPAPGDITPLIVVSMLALALLCSAVAYLIFFRLMADIGPTKSLTVTFLIPLFALLWGVIFLQEVITLNTLLGCAMVILATWLVAFPGKPQAQRS